MIHPNATCLSKHTEIEPSFWEEYTRLWLNSKGRSPFQSPHILQLYAGRPDKPIAVFQYYLAGELAGAAFFKQSDDAYTFLSDYKTDHNFFVIHQRCSDAEIRALFDAFLAAVKKENWTLMLNNQPGWAPYLDIFDAAGRASGLYWQNIKYSVCPIADEETPEALFKRVSGSRELRYRINKLKNQENAVFEVLEDDTEIDLWADEFCQSHVLRWADTPTPSAYRDPQRRQFLKNCLHAWNADGILRRFSVKVATGRVGFVIGLLEENSLVHHSTTFHPDYWKYSPGKALILFMTEWMKAHNLRVLDFGDGDEPYKYTVANRENDLRRIFISSPSNLPFILKTKAIKVIRDNPKIYGFYRDKIKRLTQRVQI